MVDAKREDIVAICVVGIFMMGINMKLLNMDKDVDVGDF